MTYLINFLKVHMNFESPANCFQCEKYQGVFDLFASYRKDSDFTSIYYSDSGFYWNSETATNNVTDIFGSKSNDSSRFAVTLISNCVSGRLNLIKEHQKYINIDIYGKCGLTCPEHTDCRAYLSKFYKFFFVFENSICTDYVTEKLFDTLKYSIIPIVVGTKDVDFSFWVPKSGYINAQDYKDPQDLANYLKELDNDQKAFNKYFEWKKYLRINQKPPIQYYLCEMCIKLNLEEVTGIVEKKKQITNMTKLWNAIENCWGFSNLSYSDIKKGVNLQNQIWLGPDTVIDRY